MRFPRWPRWVWRCYAATFAAVAAFLVCSFLPIWGVYEVVSDGYCGLGTSVGGGTLWEMLLGVRPGVYFDGTHRRSFTWEWETPAVITAVAVHVAAVVGAILGGIRWRKGE